MIKFGTGGWRAVIGDEFTKQNLQLLVQGLCDEIKSSGQETLPVTVGFDRRFLSDMAAKWVCQVLAGNGIRAKLIHKEAPTPLIMFQVRQDHADFGLSVTASHNPAIYNGIKVFTRGGRDASMEVTNAIEKRIGNVDTVLSMDYEEALKEGLVETIDPFNAYIDSILGMTDQEAFRDRNLKILLDPMHGVSKTCLQTILLTLRCNLDVINDRHDTLFGGKLPSPSSFTLGYLKNLVVEKKYDLGLGTDGDADRLGVIDDTGRFVDPNEIMVLLYYYLNKYKGWKGDVVRNIATTHLLDRMAEDFGAKCHEVPVGFKHISSKMEETDAVLGGESSGGLTIRGHILGKDGIFAATLLVEMICRTNKRISQMLEEIHGRYGYCTIVEKSYEFNEQQKQRMTELLFIEKAIPDFHMPVLRAGYEDGLKITFETGWLVVRFSGTEPLLRVFCEMPDEEEAEKTCKVMKDFLEV
ncbi:MAG: phosphoglucomutase/phosphomannomutase family protein [Clostridia bacterium]